MFTLGHAQWFPIWKYLVQLLLAFGTSAIFPTNEFYKGFNPRGLRYLLNRVPQP
jgi:hypothetical protein